MGAGFSHEGSLRALKIENDDKSAAFELLFTTFAANFPGASEQQKTKALIRALFSFEIWPRTVTSTKK